jgi:transposase
MKNGGISSRSSLRPKMAAAVNGIMYVLSTGCQWHYVPKDLPAKSTLYDYFDLWTYDGTLENIHHALPQTRQGLGKPQSHRSRILETRIHSPHAAKAL